MKVNLSFLISKFIYLKRSFGRKPFKLLDVGAGNYSASKTKSVFPNCEYYGIDIIKEYSNTEEDFNLMTDFYELDLTKLEFDIIPNAYFDGLLMTHVIEHLHNGDKVIEQLLPKLKQGGYLYVEYPGQKSTKLPSMTGTLNFYDDPTHVRIYSVKELASLFEKNNCTVLKKGTRRNIWFILAMPFLILSFLIRGKKITGNIFWDLLGFAEFLWVKKN